jgi:hypothetical protein
VYPQACAKRTEAPPQRFPGETEEVARGWRKAKDLATTIDMRAELLVLGVAPQSGLDEDEGPVPELGQVPGEAHGTKCRAGIVRRKCRNDHQDVPSARTHA